VQEAMSAPARDALRLVRALGHVSSSERTMRPSGRASV
jgi:hypothetical protein